MLASSSQYYGTDSNYKSNEWKFNVLSHVSLRGRCAIGFTTNVWIGLKKSKTQDYVYRTFNIELIYIHLPDVCAH